ncbi:MAG: UDP-2,3-diacylglucosamine diphosphatase [Bacteroidota bacterium]
MAEGKKTYFISDVHLGHPDSTSSRIREKLLVRFLDEIRHKTETLYLVGDIFDFWHEWKRVVPKGYTRFMGKIAEFTDAGIPVHFFTGNHDLWIRDYLTAETGVILHRQELITEIGGKRFYIAHGDGLGPGDMGFKRMKRVFTSRFAQWLFARIHPNFSVWVAAKWSGNSRYKLAPEELVFKGEDRERLVIFSKEKLKESHFDYFIFGHRHIPIIIDLNEKSKFINLGDWIENMSYVVVDKDGLRLEKYL